MTDHAWKMFYSLATAIVMAFIAKKKNVWLQKFKNI